MRNSFFVACSIMTQFSYNKHSVAFIYEVYTLIIHKSYFDNYHKQYTPSVPINMKRLLFDTRFYIVLFCELEKGK